jgi:signal transduction histidine kinase
VNKDENTETNKINALLVRYFGLREDADFDTERAQAVVRVIVILVIAAFVIPMTLLGMMPRIAMYMLLALYTIYVPYSLALIWWIIRDPGHKPLRRMLTIASDYTAIALVFSTGGSPVIAIFSVLIWVTVGNGLRFGTPYLVGSTFSALIVVCVASVFNDYLRQAPYLVFTFATTALVVPSYVYVLQSRLQHAYKAAQDASLSKSKFLAQASHDLRQPIHAISLFTACLRDAGLQQRELQMVDNIDRSLQGVSRLFKSLLDVSTLDSGKVEPRWEVVDVRDILADVVRQNSESAQQSGGEIRLVESSQRVKIDRALLTTMVQNIVSNALKYAPGADILIGCRLRRGSLSIEICDRGPGIAKIHHEQIFEEFYQIRDRGDRDVDGVGLGLSIVRRLAALLDLEIVLTSRVGYGTRVAIEGLRRVRRQKPVLRTAMPGARPADRLAGLRILLIEDDPAVLAATASLLQRWGCDVRAEMAMPKVIDDCDLLITDYDLGAGVTGNECIRQLRQSLGWCVPAIIMSGHDANRVQDNLDDPDIPILSKPVLPSELRSVISTKALDLAAGQGGPFMASGFASGTA